MVAGNKMQRITKRDGVDYAAKLKLLRGSAVEEGRPTKNNVTTAKGNEFVPPGVWESILQYKNYISALCAVTAAGAAFWWDKRKKRGNFPSCSISNCPLGGEKNQPKNQPLGSERLHLSRF